MACEGFLSIWLRSYGKWIFPDFGKSQIWIDPPDPIFGHFRDFLFTSCSAYSPPAIPKDLLRSAEPLQEFEFLMNLGFLLFFSMAHGSLIYVLTPKFFFIIRRSILWSIRCTNMVGLLHTVFKWGGIPYRVNRCNSPPKIFSISVSFRDILAVDPVIESGSRGGNMAKFWWRYLQR